MFYLRGNGLNITYDEFNYTELNYTNYNYSHLEDHNITTWVDWFISWYW
jgi:hypothetical protein